MKLILEIALVASLQKACGGGELKIQIPRFLAAGAKWPLACYFFVLHREADVRTSQIALVTSLQKSCGGGELKIQIPRFLAGGAKWSNLITTLPGSNTRNC